MMKFDEDNRKLLTVVIPIYNMQSTLKRCLDSIVNQSLKALDILCIDDCSTDGSFDILKDYQIAWPNIRIEHFTQNMQLGYSRNYALGLVTTKYMTFVDADDWVDTQVYEKCINRMVADQSDIAIFGIKDEYENKICSRVRYEYGDNCIGGDFALSLLCNAFTQDVSISPIVNNKIYCTSFLQQNKIHFSNLAFYEDMPFSYTAMKCAKKISLVGNEFYHYYQNPKSKLHNITKNQISDFCRSLSLIYSELNCEDIYENKLFYAFLDKSFTAFVNRIDQNILSSTTKKEYIIFLMTELTKVIPLKYILEYIDVNRIIDAVRMAD